MGYQALLFCPDEKIARTVTQVLSELEFTVESCVEPFAAVKKLMAEHYDAVVVDCDNDQNATLLFKSARNSATNQASLAVAVVEGQAGVAKAFRIGANLVLTKPINVEQAKGTLRVARGLLRKGEAAKPSASAGAPAPAPSAPPKPAIAVPAAPARPATLSAASAPKPRPAAPPASKPAPAAAARPQGQTAATAAASSASSPVAKSVGQNVAEQPAAKSALPAVSAPAPSPVKTAPISASPVSGSGAASAPAPARETPAPVVEVAAPNVIVPPAPSDKIAGATSTTTTTPADLKTSESTAAAAPAFTFGGANLPEKPASGNSKVFLSIAAVVFLVCAIYFGWTQLHEKLNTPSTTSSPASPAPTKAPSATQPAVQSAAGQSPAASGAASAAGTQTALPQSQAANSQSSSEEASDDSDNNGAAVHPSNSKASASSSATSSTTAPASKPNAQPPAQPIVLKNSATKSSAKPGAVDTSAPSMDGLAAAGGSDGSLSNLTAGDAAAKPILQTLTVSQGLSQGLLLKKVQPAYPPTALRMRTEGSVKLLATIGKTGNVASVKIVSGEPLLSRAASDAVKQWKYKPYLLNGEPVEIETEVTINFKLPN